MKSDSTNDGIILIEQEGIKLVYNFDRLTMQQKELATECLRFKLEQTKKPATKFEHVLASGGAEYNLRILSYILLPVNKTTGEPEKFSRSKADTDVYGKVCNLYGENVEKQLMEVGEDFFRRRNMSEIYSDVRELALLDLNNLLQGALSTQVQSAIGSSNSAAQTPTASTGSTTPEN